MKHHAWDPVNIARLKRERGVLFDADGNAYLAWQCVAYLWSPGGYERAAA